MPSRESLKIKEAAARLESAPKAAAPSDNGLAATLASIEEVRLEEVSGEDWSAPTAEAVGAASRLLAYAAGALNGRRMPVGQAASTGMGGLHVYWSLGDRRLELIAGAQGQLRIYHRGDGDVGVDDLSTGREMATWFDWLEDGS